jgi:hypothetical protein
MSSGINRILLFVRLGIILIFILVFYSSLSRRVKMVYLFSLCVVSVLSGRPVFFLNLENFENLIKFVHFITHLRMWYQFILSSIAIYRERNVMWFSWRYFTSLPAIICINTVTKHSRSLAKAQKCSQRRQCSIDLKTSEKMGFRELGNKIYLKNICIITIEIY